MTSVNTTMHLDEIFNQKPRYDTVWHDTVDRRYTQQFLDNELYVDLDGKQFKKWWTNPESELSNGAIFSTAHLGNQTIGVAIVLMPEKLTSYALKNQSDVLPLGTIGVFVQEKYRSQGIATKLLKNLDYGMRHVIPFDGEYVVFCTGPTCDLVDKHLKNSITHHKLDTLLGD